MGSPAYYLRGVGYGSFESDIVNVIINSVAKGYRWGGGDPEKVLRFAMPLVDMESTLVWQTAVSNAPHERRTLADKDRMP